MLGKLIKHDFLANARFLGPAYIVMLIIALFGRFFTWLATRKAIMDAVAPAFGNIIKLLSSLLTVAFVIAPFAILFAAAFFVIYRFYKNIFTDEGYLMNTLPTRPVNLVFSKLLNALIWMLITIVVAGLSWYLAVGHLDGLRDVLTQIWDTIINLFLSNREAIHEQLGVPIWLFIVELVFFILCWFARFAISWFFAIAFGQLIAKNHKVLGAIGAYVGLAIVSNIFSTAYLGALGKVINNVASNGLALQYTMMGNAVLFLIITGLLYWATTSIMKNRLNLD
ncbi:MAG: hypothetical protein IJ720_02815 [Clostridia bacterium]|nr:hypothetical protein [Clostridia bacterium]MBR1704276.1 hypothetical protein [Clostridia bacterium]